MKPKWYPEVVEKYFEEGIEFKILFYAGVTAFKIKSLDFGFDSATVICTDSESAYHNSEQAISLSRLEDILLARETPPLRYIYVNRWYDEQGVPHYHGVYSTQPTIELAQKYTKFNMLAIGVDLVYQAENEEDMFDYLGDVNRNRGNDGENLDSLGTMDWL